MTHLSDSDYTDHFFTSFPSKRSALRLVNKNYHEKLQQVGACLKGAAQKYGEEALMGTCQSSHFGKDNEVFLAGQSSQNGHIYQEGSEDEIDDNSPCYQSALSQQQHLFSEIQGIRKILKIKSAPLNIEKAAQHSPINWELLIKQSRPLHRELIRTKINKSSSDPSQNSRDYIAYTQQSSTQFIPLKDEKISRQPSSKVKKETKINQKEEVLRNIEARVMHSSCTMESSGKMCKQNTKCLQLLNRLNKQKREREELLKGISFNLAK